MKCSKATKLLQAYLDNELSASREKQIEHHLKGCSLCRLRLVALKKTSEAMDSWQPGLARKDLVTPVMEVLRYEQETPSIFQQLFGVVLENRRKILAVGANLVILLFVALRMPTFITQTKGPVTSALALAPAESESVPVYDPVDMTAYLNSLVDEHNLSPVEKDMIIGNFINDANGFIDIRPESSPAPVSVRRVRSYQVIYSYNSSKEPVTRRILFIQQSRYNRIEDGALESNE